MADGTKIIVDSVTVNPNTGHIFIRVHTVTTEGNATWNGPVRGHGLDAAMFKHRFNSDIEQVKSWMVSEHLGLHGAHQTLVAELHKLKGTVIG